MYRTLLFFPHEIGPLPLFGLGWVLVALAVAFSLRLMWAQRQIKRSRDSSVPAPTIGQILSGEGIFWVVAAAIAVFVMPSVELKNVDGDPVGLAIRGYGVMLVLGVGSAVALAAYRAARAGMNPELIYALAPWVFVGGMVGARLFYVIQYRHEYYGGTAWETIKNMLAFTEGGLVVYGSFIGGFLAFVVFTLRHQIPLLRFGDVIVPCIFLGVFFGRIGCLMNGCCYGGRCEPGWAALRFPPLTKIYQEQLSSGELLGMNLDPVTGKVLAVAPGSIAQDLGIRSGDHYEAGQFDRRPFDHADRSMPMEEVVPGWLMRVSGKTYALDPDRLPSRALPVVAAQPIASAGALMLCVVLCLMSRWIRKTGALMFIGFASYSVMRFILEIVRVDEAGQFSTSLTISQWVSMIVFASSIAALIWLYAFHRSSGDVDVVNVEPPK